MRARPKYQVFISSTYGDLQEVREAVAWTVLSARHIPAGMENFTATDDRGWQTIKSVIDKSDYFVLILAGRYGSLDSDGKSWTEKEYDYAISKRIPVLVFIRSKNSIVASMLDEPKLAAKLNKLKLTVRKKHMGSEWETKEELVGQVGSALQNHIADDEDRGAGRPGWYRGNELPNFETLDEFARLSSENAGLKAELELLKSAVDPVSFLELVGRDELPLPPKEISRRELKIPSPGMTSLEEMAKHNNDYLALNLFMILEFGIRNTGRSLIEHVIIDLSVASVLGFYCGWHGRNLSETGTLTNSTIVAAHKSKHPEFIRLVTSGHVIMRSVVSG
jgi:hypothetical protein